ncbi:MAG TPA: hypothetical protein DCW68_01495 [Rhodospirillaceae bacterium]|nr:MAG: hypothetical protein A2018_04460 [Alphaproteobacteria bacterium GWF2_58_20]HAU28772.1 hypothetical protein [Rhodospirillaceae bacterium]
MNWMALFFLLAGIISLSSAAYLAQQVSNFLASAQKARGIVVRQETGNTSTSDDKQEPDKTTLYAPVVRFLDEAGTYHEFTSQVGSNPPRWPNGSGVEILYDPKNPETASISMPLVLWTKPLILAAIGSIMLLGAILNIA